MISSEQGAAVTAGAEWRRHWPLVAATAAGMSLAALTVTVMGVMMAPIEEEFGWTRAQISSGQAIIAFLGLLSAPAGYVVDRFGPRKVGIVVVLMMLVSTTLMGTVQSLWQWWAAWGLFALAGTATSTVWLLPVSNYFAAGRGLAIGVTFGGAGITAMIAPIIAEHFVAHQGWRAAYFGLAAIWSVLTLPLVLAFVPGRAAEKAKAKADEDAGTARPLTGLTPGQGLRAKAFYILLFAALANTLAMVGIGMNLVPVLVSTGITRVDAVYLAGLAGMASLGGRFLSGWLMDRFDVRPLVIGAVAASMIMPAALLFAPGVFWVAAIALVLAGLTGATKLNATVYLAGTHLGLRSFGLLYGAIATATTVAVGLGPMVANHIYDVTRSYDLVIWAAFPAYLITLGLLCALGPAPTFAEDAIEPEEAQALGDGLPPIAAPAPPHP